MVLDNFYRFLQYEKRYSPNTLLSYKTDLKQFSLFLEQEYEHLLPEKATSPQIRSWLAGLMAQKQSARSINRKISSLNSFYKYLESIQVLQVNPMGKVTSPKQSRKLPVFIPEGHLESLFEQLNFSHDFKGLRDRLILEMFYVTGMRLAELIMLKHEDIDLNALQIRVKGKGNKQRLIPMVNSLVLNYKDYCERKAVKFPFLQSGDVFVTDKGKKIYPKFVYRLVNFYLSNATTVSQKSPHVLRHSFATHMLNQGADLNAIKELLGHSSLSATQVYTHNTVEKLKKVYKLAHPKA